MELEELKNQWNLLSEQLKKNEIINHEAIKRMIEKRTLSARDRLIGANVIAVFVLTGMLFLFPLAATRVIIRQENFSGCSTSCFHSSFYIHYGTYMYCINSIWLPVPYSNSTVGYYPISAGFA